MKPLNENWITEKTLDFEYKKYLLLGWLQSVESEFRTIRLYPALSQLIAHYRNAMQLNLQKAGMTAQFPKKITGIDSGRLQLEFESLLRDDESMQAIQRILEFSLPKMEAWIHEGRSIYEFLEQGIEFAPVGIVPLRTAEGYLLLSQDQQDTQVYSFEMTIYDQQDSPWRALHTRYVASWKKNMTNTFESIKAELVRTFTELPNPAVYVAVSERSMPLEQTFLPIAKRMLLKTISA